MTASPIWDVAFLLALLAQLARAAELLLRPHQQRWVQDRCESLALRVEYLRPTKWFPLLARTRWLSGVTLWIGIIVLVFLTLFMLTRLSDMLPHRFLLLIGGGLYFGLGILGIATLARRVSAWIRGDGAFSGFLQRVLLFQGGSVLLVGLVWFAMPLILVWLPGLVGSWWGLALIFLWFLIFLASTLIVAIAAGWGCLFWLLILIECALLASAAVIAALRWLVWRVVEYNRGAWAALSLLATVLLGLAALWSRTATRP